MASMMCGPSLALVGYRCVGGLAVGTLSLLGSKEITCGEEGSLCTLVGVQDGSGTGVFTIWAVIGLDIGSGC